MIVKKRTRYTIGPSGIKDGPGWRLTANAGDLRAYYITQKVAIDAAVTLCKSRLKHYGQLSELHIKGRNGKVRDARTYGKDPRGNG